MLTMTTVGNFEKQLINHGINSINGITWTLALLRSCTTKIVNHTKLDLLTFPVPWRSYASNTIVTSSYVTNTIVTSRYVTNTIITNSYVTNTIVTNSYVTNTTNKNHANLW